MNPDKQREQFEESMRAMLDAHDRFKASKDDTAAAELMAKINAFAEEASKPQPRVVNMGPTTYGTPFAQTRAAAEASRTAGSIRSAATTYGPGSEPQLGDPSPFVNLARGIVNTVQIGVPGDGGNAIGPEWDRQLNAVQQAFSPMRQIARVVKAATGGWQTVVATTEVGAQIVATDVTARAAQTTPNFEKVTPAGCGLSAVAPLTTWAIEDAEGSSGYNLAQFIVESIARQFAVTEGGLFITGTGTNQPLGLLSGAAPVTTADALRAFGTLQYVKSGAAATIGTNLDPILACLYAMRPAYRAKASFLMNPATLQTIRQMKDQQLRYLWEPANQAGEPSRLAGVPVYEDPNMPVAAANAFPIAVGDFSAGYVIVDSGQIRFVRDEVTAPGQVKIWSERRVYASGTDSCAIKLLKCEA